MGELEKLSCKVKDVLEKEASTGWGKFLKGVRREWEKFLLFANIASKDDVKQEIKDLNLVVLDNGLQGEASEPEIIREEMARKAFEQLDIFLKVAVPILEDLRKLFKELNMDDPTRV